MPFAMYRACRAVDVGHAIAVTHSAPGVAAEKACHVVDVGHAVAVEHSAPGVAGAIGMLPCRKASAHVSRRPG